MNDQISVINGVSVETDGDVTHFRVVDDEPKVERQTMKPSNPLTRIWNWWRNSKVKPYVNVRDFNSQGRDEYHMDDAEPATGIEVGIKVEF